MAKQIRIDLIVDDKGSVTIKNFEQTTQQVVAQVNNSLQTMRSGWQRVGDFAERAFFIIQGFRALSRVLDTLNESATRAVSATEGLGAIAEFKGVEGAQQAVEELDAVRAGLLSTFDAADALKNLLARGYNLEQAIGTITRLGEAAAFNRASHLTLGEAIRTATEGLKNENSVLVDNAGVTKNVAAIWKDYAESIGKSVTDLNLAEKIQAEYLGILQETEPMVGNLARLTETGAGAQARFSAELEKTRASIGLMVQTAGGPFVRALSGIINLFNSAPPILQRFVVAITATAAALAILRKSLIALEISMGPTGWLIAGVSLLATTFGLLSTEAGDAKTELAGVEKELGKVIGKREELERFKALGRLPVVQSELEEAREGLAGLLKDLERGSASAQKVAQETQRIVQDLGFERGSVRIQNRIEILQSGLTQYIRKWQEVNAVLEGAGQQQVSFLEFAQALQNDAIKAANNQQIQITSGVVLRARELEALQQVNMQLGQVVKKEQELATTRKISEGSLKAAQQTADDTNQIVGDTVDAQKAATAEKIKDLDRLKEYQFQTNRITLGEYLAYLQNRLANTKRETAAEILEWSQLFDKIQRLKAQAQEDAILEFKIEAPEFPLVERPEPIVGEPAGTGGFFQTGQEYLAMIQQIQFEVLNLSGALQNVLVNQWLNGISAAKAFEAAVKQIIANIVARLASNAIIFGLLSLIPGFGQFLGVGSFSKFLFQGFARGGFTGAGAENEMAGVVHRGEFVFPKTITERFRPLFELILKNPQGFQGGGFVGGDPEKVIEKEKKRVDSIAISKTLIDRYKPLFKVIMSVGKGFQQGGFVDPGDRKKPDDLMPIPLRIVEKYKSFFNLVMGNVQPGVQLQAPLAEERQRQLAGTIRDERAAQPGQFVMIPQMIIERYKPIFERIKEWERGFQGGGFTGMGGLSEVAGIVHRGEFVFPANVTKRYRGIFEMILGKFRGYQSGGYVQSFIPPAVPGVQTLEVIVKPGQFELEGRTLKTLVDIETVLDDNRTL